MAKRSKQKAKKRTKAPAKGRKRAQAKRAATRKAKKARRPARKSKAVETLRTPPSSLDMNRSPSAARSGHQAIADNQRRHNKFAAITAGDVDADMESAYFTGDETPGGENPTPDQSGVDDLGHSMGVEYQGNQELQGGEELVERDKHRWENE